MPGICGLIKMDNKTIVGSSLLDSMAVSMKNVPEEDIAVIIDKNIGLGVSSIKKDEDIYSDRDLFVVSAGEAYGLSGPLASGIATLYKRYKEDCLHNIEGQFNFCLVDRRDERLFAATDRFGTSLFHYFYDGKELVFASKIRAILKALGTRPGLSADSIFNYLVFGFVPTPYTIYEGINKLPPGHYIVLDKNGLKMRQYWDVSYAVSAHRSEQYYCQRLKSMLEDAVRMRVGKGGTGRDSAGAFLSGGLDSSTVAGMMKAVSGDRVKTFSAVFHEKEYSEIEYIDIAAKHFGLDNYKCYLKPEDLTHAIDILIKEYDEPFSTSSAIAAYYCMKTAKDNGINIMLGGDGGDEGFAGYDRYVKDKVYSLYQQIPQPLRAALIEPFTANKPFKDWPLVKKARNYITHAHIPNPERFFYYSLYPFYNRHEIFDGAFLEKVDVAAPFRIIDSHFNAPNTQDPVNRLMYLDVKLSLIDSDVRGKIDKIGQILGMTVRYPMLDTKLWALSADIPANLKIRGFNKKYIFKKALRDFLPREIILKKKHGFGLPFSVWLRTDRKLRDFTEDILSGSGIARRGYFKEAFFKKMLKMHDAEKSPYYGDVLWVFLMLELWHRKWMDGQ